MQTRPLAIEALFDRYVNTFASHDLDAIVALHAEDTQFWLHTGQPAVHGRDAVRQVFGGFFRQWPGFGFETYRVLVGPRHWVLDWAATAKLAGSGGKEVPVRFDCLDVVTVDDDGLVLRKDTYVDMVQVQKALTAAA